MVIMSEDLFNEYQHMREAYLVAQSVRQGLDEVDGGAGRDAHQVIDDLRNKYGL